MDFFWPGVLGEPKAFLVFCNSILSLAKKERTHPKQQCLKPTQSFAKPYLKHAPNHFFKGIVHEQPRFSIVKLLGGFRIVEIFLARCTW